MNIGDEAKFCATLGRGIMEWNNVEALLRLLLYKAAGGSGDRIDVLIANLGTVAIGQSLQAISATWDEPLRGHLRHCAALFEAARLFRNHYVHDTLMLGTTGDDNQTIALTQHSKIANGSLKLRQGTIDQGQLEAFNAQISTLRNYGSDLIGYMWAIPGRESLDGLEKPPLPDKLVLKRLNAIESRRAASEA